REREHSGEVSGLGGVASEHDIALPGSILSTGIGACGADEEIVEAVAVEISRGAHGMARFVAEVHAGEHEPCAAVAAASRQQARERKDSGETRVAPEHDVALS